MSAVLSETREIPSSELTRGLVMYPGDQQDSRRLVTGFADALIALDLPAGVWCWRKAEIGREMPLVRELSVEHLRDEQRRAELADARQLRQHRNRVFGP